eukprot:scaffold323_cov414-Prasinococcus_capsulatus_cf.AAC.11
MRGAVALGAGSYQDGVDRDVLHHVGCRRSDRQKTVRRLGIPYPDCTITRSRENASAIPAVDSSVHKGVVSAQLLQSLPRL